MLEINRTEKNLKPSYGFIIAGVGLLFIIFIAKPLVMRTGLVGQAFVELGILSIALISAFLYKGNLWDIFPVKKPSFWETLGTIVICIGTAILVFLAVLMMTYILPMGFSQFSEGVSNVNNIFSIREVLFILIMMPAICEEVLMRGFILASFRSFKHKWLIILLVGVIFGIYHIDLYRLLPTIILGVFITYVMIETNNLFYPILFHLFYGFTSFSSFTNPLQLLQGSEGLFLPLYALGGFLVLGSAAPFIMLLGGYLLRKNKGMEEIKIKKRKIKGIYVAVISMAAMIATGFTIFAMNFMYLPVFKTYIDMNINCRTTDIIKPLAIDRENTYVMEYSVENERGLVDIEIVNEAGESIFYTAIDQGYSTDGIELAEGNYNVIVSFHLDDLDEYYEDRDFQEYYTEEELNLTGDLMDFSPAVVNITIQ